jgi:hypothetical protein
MKTMLKTIHKKLNIFLLKHGLVKIDVEPTSELLKVIKNVYGIQFKLYSDDGEIAIGAFKENILIGTKSYIYSKMPCVDIKPVVLFHPLRSYVYTIRNRYNTFHNRYTAYDIEQMLDDIKSSILLYSYEKSQVYCTQNDLTSFSIPSGKSENEIIMKIKLSN